MTDPELKAPPADEPVKDDDTDESPMLSARESELMGMKKVKDLRAECRRLDALLADAPPSDLLPVAYHISGAPFNNSLIRVIRCGVRGPEADLWMVVAHGRNITREGTPLATAHPYHHWKGNLKTRVGMPLAEALKIARSA